MSSSPGTGAARRRLTRTARKARGWGCSPGTVEEQYVDYLYPEENGNKTEVRWVALSDADGTGLLAVGMPLLNVSVHHFTTEELTLARHPFDLVRRPEITLNLDYAQSGLGSASCGPGRLEKYQLQGRGNAFQPAPAALLGRKRLCDGVEQTGVLRNTK